MSRSALWRQEGSSKEREKYALELFESALSLGMVSFQEFLKFYKRELIRVILSFMPESREDQRCNTSKKDTWNRRRDRRVWLESHASGKYC